MWHELVLAGVGGRTIEEAKERLSYPEALAWFAYRRKHGPLSIIRRLEWGLAQVAFVVASVNGGKRTGGGKLKFEDFLPKWGDAVNEQEEVADADRQITLDELKQIFGARVKR